MKYRTIVILFASLLTFQCLQAVPVRREPQADLMACLGALAPVAPYRFRPLGESGNQYLIVLGRTAYMLTRENERSPWSLAAHQIPEGRQAQMVVGKAKVEQVLYQDFQLPQPGGPGALLRITTYSNTTTDVESFNWGNVPPDFMPAPSAPLDQSLRTTREQLLPIVETEISAVAERHASMVRTDQTEWENFLVSKAYAPNRWRFAKWSRTACLPPRTVQIKPCARGRLRTNLVVLTA